MKATVEFHDSKVASVRMVAGDMEVLLSPAYVHRSLGIPGIDPGEGHHQAVTLRLTAAAVSGDYSAFVGCLSDGSLSAPGVIHGEVPLPYSTQCKVHLSLILDTGATLEATASAVDCMPSGPTTYVEQFPG